MTKNHSYNTPAKGTTNWDVPLNENFTSLDTDVEVRDVDANRTNYTPADGSKFFATDSGAVYEGDGNTWNFVGYVTTPGFAGSSHYVNYASGLTDEEVSKFFLESGETLEVFRIAAPMKGVAAGTVDSNVKLTVYEGGSGGSKVVEVAGNDHKSARNSGGKPWVASSSPVTVNVTTGDSTANVAPGVWIAVRRQ